MGFTCCVTKIPPPRTHAARVARPPHAQERLQYRLLPGLCRRASRPCSWLRRQALDQAAGKSRTPPPPEVTDGGSEGRRPSRSPRRSAAVGRRRGRVIGETAASLEADARSRKDKRTAAWRSPARLATRSIQSRPERRVEAGPAHRAGRTTVLQPGAAHALAAAAFSRLSCRGSTRPTGSAARSRRRTRTATRPRRPCRSSSSPASAAAARQVPARGLPSARPFRPGEIDRPRRPVEPE